MNFKALAPNTVLEVKAKNATVCLAVLRVCVCVCVILPWAEESPLPVDSRVGKLRAERKDEDAGGGEHQVWKGMWCLKGITKVFQHHPSASLEKLPANNSTVPYKPLHCPLQTVPLSPPPTQVSQKSQA